MGDPVSAAIRLVSIPARHPYVSAVSPPGVTMVDPDRVAGWDPDPMLTPAAVAAADADLVHLHFGYDHLHTDDIRWWLAALAEHGLPLVLTVHDLRNPHHDDPHPHHEALQLLIPAARTVITLTDGAAQEIRTRYGREAIVLPHPTVGDPTRSAGVSTEHRLAVLHLKSLRRNVLEPVPLAAAAAAGAQDAGGRLRVDIHPAVVDDPRLAGLSDAVQNRGGELVVHQRFDDIDLERYLRRAHVTVLPYRWGTHSGWLELARDLGTRVVAPSCGRYRDQWPAVIGYVNDETRGLVAASLRSAVRQALTEPAPAPAPRAKRLRQLDEIRQAHARIYAAAVRPPQPEIR